MDCSKAVLSLWCALGAIVFPCSAADGILADLYKRFLTNPHSEDLISFEREILIPKRDAGEREVRLPNGSVARVHGWDRDYFAFVSDGPRWLIAFSTRSAITNDSDPSVAEELLGFDGRSYWTLQLDNPFTIRSTSTNLHEQLPPSISFNLLTVIPKEEAQREQGQFQSDVKLATLLGLLAECRTVTQFGCTNEMQHMPRLDGSRLLLPIFDNNTRIAQLEGAPKRPKAISYITTTPGSVTVTAALDYRADTITITRSFRAKVFFNARYRLMAVALPTVARNDDFYSWRRYKKDAGRVLATIVTNGATVELNIAKDDTLTPGRVIGKARPIAKRSNALIYLIYSLFALLTLPWVRLAYKHARKRNNRKQEETHL